jgi:hypothetical protein
MLNKAKRAFHRRDKGLLLLLQLFNNSFELKETSRFLPFPPRGKNLRQQRLIVVPLLRPVHFFL